MSKSRAIKFEIGGTFYFFDAKCHIVALIENGMVVFKWYKKSKQYWTYQVEHWRHIENMHSIAIERKESNKGARE